MIVQSEEGDSESNDDKMVLAAEGDTCQTGCFTVKACIASKEIKDLIVDTGSAVSLVSSQCYETITNHGKLQPLKGR